VIVRPEHRKTFPSARIADTLMMFVRLRGGAKAAMNSAAVYAPLADFYELSEQDRVLCASDYYIGKTKPGPAWESEVKAAFKDLKGDGYLVSENVSGKSIWRLTPNGIERADFWLKRMTAKASVLQSLKVDAGPSRLDAGDASEHGHSVDQADA
jgi:hypothetical protein